MTLVILAVPVLYFGYILLGSHDLTDDERSRMKAYIWLFVAAAIFWMIYDLAPTRAAVLRPEQHRPVAVRHPDPRPRPRRRSTRCSS